MPDIWGRGGTPTLPMPHFKKCICRQLDCYLRLNAGLRCIFEASIQSGVYHSQDRNHKNRVKTENFRVRARSLSWLFQHLSLMSSHCQMEQWELHESLSTGQGDSLQWKPAVPWSCWCLQLCLVKYEART